MREKKLAWIQDAMDDLRESGLYIHLRTIESPPGAWMVVDGKRVLNLCTNNYLGLTFDEACIERGVAALRREGTGTTGSRVANGS